MQMEYLRQMTSDSVPMTLTNITLCKSNYIQEIIRVTSESVYIFCPVEKVSAIYRVMARAMPTYLSVWENSSITLGCCVHGNKSGSAKCFVWTPPNVSGKFQSLKLLEYLIKTDSNEGDVIFDPEDSERVKIAVKSTNRKFKSCNSGRRNVMMSKERIADVQSQLNEHFGP